jgi:general nucleoside transport system permease protein
MIDQEVRTPAPRTGGERAWRGRRALTIGVSVFAALIALRLITGETDITSSGTMSATLGLAVPIGMAAMGGLWSERSGVVNIGLEGMMVFGTWGAAFGSYFGHSPWLGLVAGVIAGALGGLLHAVATVTFGVDHIVSGVALNILAPGVTRYLSDLLFTHEAGGGATQSPQLPDFPTWSVPGVGGPLGDLEKHHWFLVSDLAGLVRGLLTNLSPVTLIAAALIPISFFLLWRTAFGLRLRSCGENPLAAESLGVKVYTMKYAAVVIAGAFAGVGGTFLAMVASSNYQEGQVNGRGFIGLAAMIFGNWRPGGVAAGAGLFGYTDALQLRGGAGAVHAMLLLLGVGLLALAVWHAYRRRMVTAAVSAGVAVLLLAWFLLTDELPREIVTYSPHITTLLVLAFAAQRLRMPAADGLRYRRGGGH